jgi:hypothetical protein
MKFEVIGMNTRSERIQLRVTYNTMAQELYDYLNNMFIIDTDFVLRTEAETILRKEYPVRKYFDIASNDRYNLYFVAEQYATVDIESDSESSAESDSEPCEDAQLLSDVELSDDSSEMSDSSDFYDHAREGVAYLLRASIALSLCVIAYKM